MSRIPLLLLTLMATAAPAAAHPGHVAETAGHAHWLALGAIGLAALIAAGISLGGRFAQRRRDRTAATTR
jgi:hypothetical protein